MDIILKHVRSLPKHIRESIINLNLFGSETEHGSVSFFREQFLTRLFLLLLIISSIITGFYIFFLVENQIVIVSQPSFTTYQQLYNDHSDTMRCPCSQVSVAYGSFLNITFILHEVCSSDLVSSTWLNYLESFDPAFLSTWADLAYSRDFRTVGNSYFQLLSTFCSLSKNNIEDAQRLFINTQLINDHIPTPLIFNQQTEDIIKSYIIDTKNEFQKSLKWITMALSSSYFYSGTNLDFIITITDGSLIASESGYMVVVLMVNIGDMTVPLYGPCSCPREFTLCSVPSVLYTDSNTFEENFNEIPVGCTPILGFLNSTFAWWYNETYLRSIQSTYSEVILLESSPNISTLNTTISTQFTNKNLTDLLEEMFLETWIGNDTHFDLFYNQCVPVSCSYTVTRRRDLFAIFLLLISICGGLNKILRLLVQGFGKFVFFLIDWWKNRNNENCM